MKKVLSERKCLLSGSLVFIYLFCYQTYATGIRVERYSPPYTQPQKGSFPWIVQKIGSGWHKCTGVLISDRHVLTSAHCLDRKLEFYNLVVAFYNNEKNLSIKAKRFILNPEYQGNISGYDLAIIEMDLPTDIATPKLDLFSDQCSYLSNVIMFAAGYELGQKLKLVELSWLTCNSSLLHILYYPGDGKTGDSGAPLFFNNNSNNIVLGIHSGSSSGDANGYSIYYAPIAKNKDFLKKYIQFVGISRSGSDSDLFLREAVSINISDWQEVSATSATSENLSFIFLSVLLTIALYAI